MKHKNITSYVKGRRMKEIARHIHMQRQRMMRRYARHKE